MRCVQEGKGGRAVEQEGSMVMVTGPVEAQQANVAAKMTMVCIHEKSKRMLIRHDVS